MTKCLIQLMDTEQVRASYYGEGYPKEPFVVDLQNQDRHHSQWRFILGSGIPLYYHDGISITPDENLEYNFKILMEK